jgi:RNA polymerase sigma-70 factor (ECF subfamily)
VDGREAALKLEVALPADVASVFDEHGAWCARVLRCLGVRDQELPDAVQEVFIVVQRRLAEFEGRASLRTWLYGICVRKALGLRRDAARKRKREGAIEREPRSERTPHDDLEKVRKLALALEILGGIGEDKRVVFVLHDVEQLPMSEVVEVVGCPLQTGYSRLYAARREIAGALRRLAAKGRIE